MSRAILAVVVVLFIFAAAQQARKPDPRPETVQPAIHAAAIRQGATEPFKGADYPKMLARIGNKAFARANALFPAMGKLASGDSGCDAVTYVGMSDSSTRSRAVLFAICDNGHKVTSSEFALRGEPDRLTQQ